MSRFERGGVSNFEFDDDFEAGFPANAPTSEDFSTSSDEETTVRNLKSGRLHKRSSK